MEQAPVYVVDIIGEVVTQVKAVLDTQLGIEINYTYGRSIQIQTKLLDYSKSPSKKNVRYPLIALFQDFPEERGKNDYYASVRLPKIVIATLTKSTDLPEDRYGKTFKPLLYPIYYEFLKQLTRNKNIVCSADPNQIPHIKWDRPGSQQEGQNMNDFLDAIEIENLVITVKQFCKK